MTTKPRNDELTALNNILENLKCKGKTSPFKIVYEPNGNTTPPDFLLNFETHPVSLEVTISGDGCIFIPSSSDPSRREPYDRSSSKMLKTLEDLIKAWIKPNETIILFFLSPIPIERRGRLAKNIEKFLKEFYFNNSLTLDKKIEFQIKTTDKNLPLLHLEAKLTDYYGGLKEYSPLKEILGITLQSPDPIAQASLSFQAEYVLLMAINEKTQKLAHVQGEKWLAILNTHSLLDSDLYQNAFSNLKKNNLTHDFTKIFIILEGIIVELISEEKNSSIN